MIEMMKSFYYRFDARLPLITAGTDKQGEKVYVPAEKLYDLGLERYAEKAFRNAEVKIRVSVPKEALDYGLIEPPKQKRHHSGHIIIEMDESLKDSVNFEVVDPEARELGLLSVEYLPGEEAGKVLAVLEMQRQTAVVDDFRIRLPSVVRGEPTSNVSIAVDVSNEVGTYNQGKGRGQGGRPRNSRVQLVNNYGLNTKMHRTAKNSGHEYRETFFWPAECSLVAKVDASMLVYPEDLVRKENGVLVPVHEAVFGAHPELLRNIFDGHFENIYLLPEVCPALKRKGRREVVMHNLPRLIQAWDNNVVSERLDASTFAANTDAPNDFYCCMGHVDQIQGRSQVTHACFGRTPSIHKITYRDGRRMTLRDDKGNPKYNNGRGGYLVLIPFKPMFQIMAVLYSAMVDGKLDRFYEEHGLLFPDSLFAEEDWEALQAHKEKRRQAKEARERAEAEPITPDDGEEDEDNADDEVELDVGDWGVADADEADESSYIKGPPAAMDSAAPDNAGSDESEPSLAGDETLSFGKFGGTSKKPDEREADDRQDGEEDSFPV